MSDFDLYPERSGPRYSRSDGTQTFNGWLHERGVLDDRGKETKFGWVAYVVALVALATIWIWLVPIMVVLIIGVTIGLPAYAVIGAWVGFRAQKAAAKKISNDAG